MILGVNINVIKDFLNNRKNSFIVLSIIIWGVFVAYIVAMSRTSLPWYFVYIRTPLSFGLIILYTASNMSSKYERISLYENRFLIYIGNISFELFLTHTQIKYIIINSSYGTTYNDIALLGLIFVISVAVSQVYSSIEKQVKRKIRNHGKVN